MPGPLGRRPPSDWKHVDRYPLTAATAPKKPSPVVIGVNWYVEFDEPEKDAAGHYWIARDGKLTTVRGGHCVCLKPRASGDPDAWWDFYDQGSEGACLKAGTLLRMADGSHKAIDEVRLLDRVLTAEGREGKVLATFVRFNPDGMVNVALAGHRHLALTGNHPLLTSRGYVRSDALRLGDEVALTRYLPATVATLETAPLLASLRRRTRPERRLAGSGGVATDVSAIPATIALTPGFGRLAGLFLADGETMPGRVLWSFGGHAREARVAETLELLRSELGAEGRVQVRRGGAMRVVLDGRHWRTLFERVFGHGRDDRRLSGVLAAGPPQFLRGVWDGWVAGGGHPQPDRHRTIAETASHGLAMDMHAIGQALGLRPAIELRRGKPGSAAASRRDSWRIAVSSGDLSSRSRQDASHVWRKVVGLEHEEWAGFVYNVEVEGDHSYVAEGVGVHNCVGFGVSRLASQLNRKTYDGFWLFHEAQKVDEWPGEDYEGTSVRAGLDILRTRGHRVVAGGQTAPESLAEGIKANRWARSVDDALSALGYGGLDYVDVLNSWGRGYPHLTRMPASVLERLWKEDGEVGLVTDR